MKRTDVAAFSIKWETKLRELRELLLSRKYTPGDYKIYAIHEKKTRIIMAAPFVDRVVHHAVCNVVNPTLERSMHPHSCANRVGKGTKYGLDLFSKYCRKYRFVLKCDIKNFFPSIDRGIMFDLLRAKIYDPELLALINILIKTPQEQSSALDYFPGDDLFTPLERKRGLPIGNMTSQTWANWYLNGLDHFITSFKGFGAYVRYVDDFAVFGNDKLLLNRLKNEISQYVGERLRLRIHQNKSRVYRTRDGVSFLGFRHYGTHRVVRKESVRRFKRRLLEKTRLLHQGLLMENQYISSIAGWCGFARMGDTYNLRASLRRKLLLLNRGSGEGESCCAWGLVEQQSEQPALRDPQQEQSGQPQQQSGFSMFPVKESAGFRFAGAAGVSDVSITARFPALCLQAEWKKEAAG